MGSNRAIRHPSEPPKTRERRFRALVDSLEPRRLLSTIYVDAIAPGPTHDGSSWTNAYTTLTQALTAATSGATINVGQGTYTPTGGTDRTISFQLKTGVGIYGGYAGYGTSNPNTRDTVNTPTILSGDIGTIGNTSDNSYNVIIASGTTATAILDGVTITAGNANGTGVSTDGGGGIYNSAGSPTINNCIFTQNLSNLGGGTIYDTSNASPTLTNCTFSANSQADEGGAIYNDLSSSPQLTNCTFNNNEGIDGAAIYDTDASPTFTDCLFRNNATAGGFAYGGAMYNNSSSSPTLIGCTFIGNVAAQSGGAFYDKSSSSISMRACQFIDNTATAGYGGAIYNTGATCTFTDCSLVGNSSKGGQGGAIYDDISGSFGTTSVTLINCALDDNFATYYGGAIYGSSNSNISAVNCTFTNNAVSSSGFSGGAIYDGLASVTLTNCILWGNVASTGSQIYYSTSGTTPSITYSDIQGSFAGTGNINSNPLFVRSPGAGHDGILGTADDDYGDLRLQSTSPCIDDGSNAAVPLGVTTDLAGKNRIINTTVDMGAYEHGMPETITGTNGNDSYYTRLSSDGSILQIWDGTAPTGNPAYSFATATLESCTFNTGNGKDQLIVDASNGLNTDLFFSGGSANDQLTVTGIPAAAPVNIQPGWLSLGAANITSTNVGSVYLNATTGTLLGFSSLNIGTSVAIPPGQSLVLDVSQLIIAGSGQLDLGDSDMIVENGSLSSIVSQIASGFGNGTWNGTTGIKSTSAANTNNTSLGVKLNNDGKGDELTSTFDGQPVANTDVLIKYTYYGDAALASSVTAADYLAIDNGFNNHLTGWNNGDFNYDGQINGDDYTLIDNAFNTQNTIPLATVASPPATPQSQIEKAAATPSVFAANFIQTTSLFDSGVWQHRKSSLANEIFV